MAKKYFKKYPSLDMIGIRITAWKVQELSNFGINMIYENFGKKLYFKN